MATASRSKRTRKGVRGAVIALVICALVAAVVEVGVFNLGWIGSLASGNPITVSLSDGSYDQTVVGHALTLKGVDTQVSNLSIQFCDDEWHDATVYVMDESKSEYRDVGTLHSSGEPLYLHTEGNTRSIRLVVDGVPGAEIASITLNGVTPLAFSAARWGLIALLLFAFWLARPNAVAWERRALDCRGAFVACACVMCCVMLVALAAGFATTTLDENDIRGMGQYTDLARALASGHVYLDIDPSAGLLALDNPYDDALRDDVEYLWDYAFFDGKYYSYFGVVPCLVFYLPFYLVTGGTLPNLVVTAVAVVAFYAGGMYLVRRLIGRWFPEASLATVALCAVALLFGTMSLSLVSLQTIYPVPIACGAACAIWALALWMRACEGDAFLWGRALLGSLLGALTLGCRPQLFLVFLLILPLFVEAVRAGRLKAWSFFPLVAPVVVVAVLLGVYNYARFGSPLDFGSSYNLTNDDMSKHGMSPYMGALGIFGFLLQPPHVIADWPFVVGVNLSYTQNSDLVLEETFGGLLAVAPITLCALWVFWKKRLGLRSQKLLVVLSVVGLACAFLLAYFDACAGGLILRYQVDMGLFLSVAACIGILGIGSASLPHPAPRACEKDPSGASADGDGLEATPDAPVRATGGLDEIVPVSATGEVARAGTSGEATTSAYAVRLVLAVMADLSIALSALYFLG